MTDNTKRFSDRVDNYIKYRPSYPNSLFLYLQEKQIIKPNYTIADIGSGTGIFSQLLLEMNNKVYGVEPNLEMREAAEKLLAKYNLFISIDGTSENSFLEDKSVDLITVAQAFHWFNVPETLKEFNRIIKPEGYLLLVWNNRLSNTEFLQDYDDILKKYATDYNEVNHQNLTDTFLEGCFKNDYQKLVFDNYQEFDFSSLLGRLNSSSYAPKVDSENYDITLKLLKESFDKNSSEGIIRFNYQTEVHLGKIS